MNMNLNGFGADCPAEQPQAALQISLPFLDKAVCACACASRHAHTGYGCAWSVQHSHNYRSNLWPWDEMQANSCRKKLQGIPNGVGCCVSMQCKAGVPCSVSPKLQESLGILQPISWAPTLVLLWSPHLILPLQYLFAGCYLCFFSTDT